MFESIGELAVVSVLLGGTVFAFLYLAYRGARVRRTSEEPAETGKGMLSITRPKVRETLGRQDAPRALKG